VLITVLITPSGDGMLHPPLFDPNPADANPQKIGAPHFVPRPRTIPLPETAELTIRELAICELTIRRRGCRGLSDHEQARSAVQMHVLAG